MDDSSLTRMAIEEIVREMQEARELELQPPMERKVNPLGKPNKRFLGRTINSVLTHNKRENDRKHENCRRKLKELDDRARRKARKLGERKHKHKKKKKESSASESSHEVYSSSTDDKERSRKKRRKKRKHRKHKRHSRASSCSSQSFKKDDDAKSQVTHHDFNNIAADYSASDYYEQINIQQYNNMAVAAYHQMSQMYSTMLRATTTICYPTEITTTIPKKEEKTSSTSSVLSISLSDESMASNTSSFPSLEADENGVATITVSSDASESEVKKISKHEKHKFADDSDVEMIVSSNNESESALKRKEEPLLISVDTDSNHSNGMDSNHSVVIVTCPTDSSEESNASACEGAGNSEHIVETIILEDDLTEE